MLIGVTRKLLYSINLISLFSQFFPPHPHLFIIFICITSNEHLTRYIQIINILLHNIIIKDKNIEHILMATARFLVGKGGRSLLLHNAPAYYIRPEYRFVHSTTAGKLKAQLLSSTSLETLMHDIHVNNGSEGHEGNELLIRMSRQRWPSKDIPMKVDEKQDDINSTSSLPQLHILKSNDELRKILNHDRPDLKSELKKRITTKYHILQNYIQFFKAGISNVWKTYWKLKKTVYRKTDPLYVFDNGLDRNDTATGNPRDKKLLLKSRTVEQIINELATAVRCKENTMKEKMWLFETDSDRNYVRLKRSAMQEMLRNKLDAPKVPFFALILLLLEELSVAVCWISPYILPTTCLYPKFMPRYFSRAIIAQRRLKELRQNRSLEEIASSNPFSMDTEETIMMCEFLMVNSSFKWVNYLENKDFMRRRLLQRYKEITVDNYLIIRDGGVEKLTELELFSTCLRRGLIDLQLLATKIKRNPNGGYKDYFDFDQMKSDLRTFIVNFDNRRNNVGLLGLSVTTSCI